MSQSATDVTRLSHVGSTTYESHDDLCVEQCVGVGLYNGSQIFNHRGAPPAIPSRWSSRVTSAAHHNPGSLYDFSLGLDPNSMHYRPGLAHSPSSTYQPWFGHQPQPDLDQSLPGGDEDSCSILSCCDSQCTMTDKCSNVTCANKEDTCTDQNCPERPAAALPSEIVDGATALISINNAPEQQQDAFPMQSFHHQESILNNFNFDLSNTSHNFPFSPLVNRVASHLLVAHGEDASSACTRPCLLDDPRNYPNCPMPTISNISSFNGQYNAASLRLQLGTDDLTACRAEVHDPETYLEHFNQQHRQFFASSNHNPLGNIQHTLPETSAMSPIGAMSSSGETPVDIHDSTEFSGTPSPLTPMSNSLDMADLKQEEIVSPLGRERSMSEVSSDGLSIHRCFWREEGLRGVCDELFSTPEELFNHASTVHIKNAKKGDQGFRCGWDDCPRSKAGASGFPQRSKIERHMQTHIDRKSYHLCDGADLTDADKPHICTVCHKGFSAKQALNQHMFIHTNQKPLVCEICNKAFRYPSALSKFGAF